MCGFFCGFNEGEMLNMYREFCECVKYECAMYSKYMFSTNSRYWMARLKREPARMILAFLRLSRTADLFEKKFHFGGPFKVIYGLLYLAFVCRKNRLGERLGLDIGTANIGKGLMIYHYGNVVNGFSVIGENCSLHGDNCIGNDGKSNNCPVIGNNVSLGVGAKILGDVYIADDIKVGAGAVVVHSFYDAGVTLAGIPARVVKRNGAQQMEVR